MQLLTIDVTVREDKGTGSILELSCVVEALEHETGKTDREIIRAVAVHDSVWVGDVVHVVGAVNDIATHPARGEHELESNTIRAVGVNVGLIGKEVTLKGGLARLVVVETVDANGHLLENALFDVAFCPPSRLLRIRLVAAPGSIKLAPRVVARNHAEAWLEWLDILTIQEVIPVK